MYKVIEQTDALKAQTLMSVVMQYIIEHFRGKSLQPKDVQQILRAVLLQEESGHYYAFDKAQATSCLLDDYCTKKVLNSAR